MKMLPNSGFIDVNGCKLGYIIEGQGSLCALVIGSSLYYSRTFSSNLRKHLKLIFVDHRGFVPSEQPIDPSSITLDLLINDIETVRQALGLQKFIIIGHSGHGYMALEYAKKFSGNVSHVVLIALGPDQSPASHHAADQYLQESICPKRKAALEKNLAHLPQELKNFPEKRFITFCLRLGARSWYDYHFDAQYLWKDIYVNMPIIDRVWGELFRDIDITQHLDKCDIPVFLALGKFDYLVAPFYAWNPLKQKFKNLTTRLFEHSSHAPYFEEAALFDKELLEWLQNSKNHTK